MNRRDETGRPVRAMSNRQDVGLGILEATTGSAPTESVGGD
jgi:hypothetical protein